MDEEWSYTYPRMRSGVANVLGMIHTPPLTAPLAHLSWLNCFTSTFAPCVTQTPPFKNF